ncbi:MAG: hypothetical protein QOG18_1855 [Microbacteriaceae bacterium]|nr:hypothetical protein [Microbacteriaceae bacterium]
MSNETPETAGTRGDSPTRKPGTPDPVAEPDAPTSTESPAAGYPDDADLTDSAEHPAVENPDAAPVGAGAHVGRAGHLSEAAPDASEPVTLVEPEPRERAEYAGTPDQPVAVTPAPVTPAPAPEAEPVAETPIAAPSNAGAAYVAAATADAAPEPSVQTVYVHAPVPPKRRGNRAVGALIALASTVVFAAIYAGIALVVMPLFTPRGSTGFNFLLFVGLPVFYVPILVYLVAFVLLVLIVNRASWWAYVLGSFIIAVLVYGVSIGVLLLTNGVFAMTPGEAFQAFAVTAFSPLLIAAIVAREVPIWFGAAIAARGRRQKQRNAEEKAAFEAELENNRSDFNRGAVDYGTN